MYKFTYKRRFWPLKFSIHGVEGHSYTPATDKMWVQTATGGQEIRKWSQCELHLGADWKSYVEKMEKERLERQAKGL